MTFQRPWIPPGICALACALGLAACASPEGPERERPRPALSSAFEPHLSNPELSAAPAEVDALQGAELRLSELLALAAQRDPVLAAARERAQGAAAARGKAGRLPDPKLMIGWFGESVQTRTGTQEGSLSIMQALPWPGKLRLAGDLAQVEAQAAELRAWLAGRDLAVEVAESFHELRYLHGALALSEDLVKLAQEFVGRAALAEPGMMAGISDEIRGETYLAQLEYDQLQLREWIALEEERLRVRLGLGPHAALGAPVAYEPEVQLPALDELRDLAFEKSPDLALAELAVRRARLQTSRARQDRYPDMSLGVRWIDTEGYGNGMPDDGEDPWMLELGVGLPVWGGAQRAAERSARHGLRAAAHELDGAKARLREKLTAAYYRWIEARRLYELHHATLLPQAERSMRAAEALLEGGQGSFAGLLETLAAWHHLRLAALRAEVDMAQRRARVEKWVGSVLSEGVAE